MYRKASMVRTEIVYRLSDDLEIFYDVGLRCKIFFVGDFFSWLDVRASTLSAQRFPRLALLAEANQPVSILDWESGEKDKITFRTIDYHHATCPSRPQRQRPYQSVLGVS